MPNETTGFLRSLFDLSFDKLVTPRVLKVIYVLVLIVAALTYLAYTVFAFTVSGALGLLTLLIFGPLGFLLTAVLWRMGLELAVAVFKIAENTGKLVEASPVASVPRPPAPPI